MTELQRVKKIIKWLIYTEFAESEREIAEKLGYTKSSLSQIVTGKVPLSDKFVNKLCSIDENINNEWIIAGEGEMLKDNKPVVKINMNGRGTPIYDIDVSCGIDHLALTDENIEGYIDLPYIKKNSHIITARGDSMEPKVNDGDKIVLRKVNKDNVFFGQIYVVVTEDYRLLKYIHKHPNDNTKVILRSENKHYDDMEISKIDILEMMVVENILSIKTMM